MKTILFLLVIIFVNLARILEWNMKKILPILIVSLIPILSYSIYSEIRRSCKYLPGEILKNENVLGFKEIIQTKDFEEVYNLEVEMKDHTTIRSKFEFFNKGKI